MKPSGFLFEKNGGNITFLLYFIRAVYIKFASIASAEIKRPFTLKQVNAWGQITL